MKAANQALWTRLKAKYRKTAEGSPPGRWSPRKAALATWEYNKRGGKWQNSPPPKSKRR